jgi:hypothetical protein
MKPEVAWDRSWNICQQRHISRHCVKKQLPSCLIEGLGIRIRMFLGFLDPDSDPLVRGTDLDPSINKEKLILLFCDFFMTFYLIKIMYMYLQKEISRKRKKDIFCWHLEGQGRK